MTDPAAQPREEPATEADSQRLAEYVRNHQCWNADPNVTIADWHRGVLAIEAEAAQGAWTTIEGDGTGTALPTVEDEGLARDRPCDCGSEKYRGVHITTCTRTRSDDPAAQPREEPPMTEAGRRFVEDWNLGIDQPVATYDLVADIRRIEAEAAAHATERPDPDGERIIRGFVRIFDQMSDHDLYLIGMKHDSAILVDAREHLAATERPRTEPLDVERLQEAINRTDVFSYDTNHDAESLAEAIATEYARLSPPAATQEGE